MILKRLDAEPPFVVPCCAEAQAESGTAAGAVLAAGRKAEEE